MSRPSETVVCCDRHKWRQADGERQLSKRLNNRLGDSAFVLDDRIIPRTKANIDHIVVSPSGVWVIDAKNYRGKVELRLVGPWRRRERKLFVNGRDRSKLTEGMQFQHETVAAALDRANLGAVPIHLVLCFVNSEWPPLNGMGTVGDVWIGHPRKLVHRIKATSGNTYRLSLDR